jgi:lysophospholipase L1-like esterase
MSIRRKLALTVITLLLMFVALEVVLHLILDAEPVWVRSLARDVFAQKQSRTSMRLGDFLYEDKQAAQEMWDEAARSAEQEYVSHVLHRRQPFTGKYINIGPDHNRATVNPEPVPGQESIQIWFFGGSTMWGTGAEGDWATVPSLVTARLAKLRPSINWQGTNFGESAFTSSNELVQFTLALKTGSPDAVVFMDGVNDWAAAKENQFAGSEVQYRLHAYLFERKSDPDNSFLKTLYLARKVGLVRSPRRALVMPGPGSEELAKETARDMTQNWKVASELAAQRGAAILGVLQPNAYCGSYGVAQNKEQSIGMYSQYYDAVRAAVPEDLEFLDLSDVMPPDERIFYDIAHTGSKGNRIIADGIAERLISLVPGE